MSKQLQPQIDAGKARIVDAPIQAPERIRHQVEHDRNFEMPTAFYGLMVGFFFAFLGVMFAGLSSPGLVIPMAIFAIFILAGFGVPAIWTRLAPDSDSSALSMGEFKRNGIMTHTGRLAPRDAALQMLILPALILLWGCAVVTIVALI